MIHWGYQGGNPGDSANQLTPLALDPNSFIQETKAFLVEWIASRVPKANYAPSANWWQNYPKYFISLLKASGPGVAHRMLAQLGHERQGQFGIQGYLRQGGKPGFTVA